MPSISKIRLTNVIYEEGIKRYNDETFLFDGHNGAILLENGGGKTVFIQTVLQAILPHVDLGERKIKNTLVLENAPAHIAVEWILNDHPRRYLVTAVSLYMTKHGLDSIRYVYEYDAHDSNGIDGIPFVKESKGVKRTAGYGEMLDYYSYMREKSIHASSFPTIKEYKAFLEEQYHIISSEWESVMKINSLEGGVEKFFDECKNTNQLFDRLLIPTVESSIAGHDSNIFVDMFEKQHTSFKNYKKLKETIQENERIQQQLEDYVLAFEQLHKKELVYDKTKQHAKGLWYETRDQKQTCSVAMQESLKNLEEWKEKSYFLDVKIASYDVRREEAFLDNLENTFKITLANQGQKEEQLLEYQTNYYSIKLAELKQVRNEQIEHVKHLEAQIEKQDQTEELTDLEEELEEARQAFLGYFLKKIEVIETAKHEIILEQRPIIHRLEDTTKDEKELLLQEKNTRAILSEIKGFISSRTQDMDTLKQVLLANPNQENVKEEMERWNKRHQFLDEEIIRRNQEEKQLFLERKEAETKKENYQKNYAELETHKNQLIFQLSMVDKEEKTIMTKLTSLRPQWGTLDSVYLKEETIEKRITEQIDKLTKERDTLLYKERIAYRFVDDHGEQANFFGDAFLEKQLKSWKNQVDYLVTGVEYLQTLAEKDQVEKQMYTLWPLTLITTEKSKDQVLMKLNHVSDRLQFPIRVMTTQEAVSLQGEAFHQSWISPKHWNTNILPDSFARWKAEIENGARVIRAHRKDKERQVKKWEEVLTAFTNFLQINSYEKVSAWKNELVQTRNDIEKLLNETSKLAKWMKEIEENLTISKEKADIHREEKQGLESRIDKGRQFLQYEKDIDIRQKQQKESDETLQKLLKKIHRVKNDLVEFTNQKNDLDSRLQTLRANEDNVKQDDDYNQLQELAPIYSDESKKNIQGRIQDLELKIRKITVTHGEWEARKKAAIDTIASYEKQISEMKTEHNYLNENITVPADSQQRLATLWEKIGSLNEELVQLRKDVQEKLMKKENQKGKLETKKEEFMDTFPGKDILSFSDSLEEVGEELPIEKTDLQQRKTYIDQEIAKLEKEIKGIDNAERILDRFMEAHHFNSPDIAKISLSSEETLKFTYNREKFIKGLTDELQRNNKEVMKEKEQVESAKNQFSDFCNRSITDVKMRNMALNGVKYKRSYNDIVDFKKNMVTSVERATNYANEHIRQKDADLQAYINHIHTHLQTLVEELKQIPKKTKVKVLDEWKQIFSFSIPEWSEEDGKARIRDYIEWILDQLESDRFMNDHGVQDEGKVRKDIEKWLQSKQLLQMMMNNEVMKVSCRKVTNDNKVSTKSHSWEQSNVWSGGEKWSKNMTLFLGILNYVAEKKQHIQTNMKRHRAVILDNPFGKASSDHVLSPVFFVAEQLGFQIIALTAHAEGKFLQDYFPIIYSCRLRASTNENKTIMTKDKWLHHAYFQDHDPKTIDRLGEVEQLPLF